MSTINRRDFMLRSAGAVATTWAAGGAAAAGAAPKPAETLAATLRPLGGAGVMSSVLGFGTGTRAWNGSSEQNRQGHAAFVRMIRYAYDRGLTYYDLADMYGAHTYMRDAIAEGVPREKVMLLTKTVRRDGEGVKADLERFRKELDSDYIDVVLLHCLTMGNWHETMQDAMDVLSEAKSRGEVKAVGVSCHHMSALKVATDLDWVDVMLSRINPYGVKMDGAPEEVVPVLRKAHENGKGMLGMKIAGEGEIADKIEESIKYVMGLGCIDAITMGFLAPEEVDYAIECLEGVKAA